MSSSEEDDDDDEVDINAEMEVWKKKKAEAKKKSAKKKSTKKKAAKKKAAKPDAKEEQLKWIEPKTIDDIVLTEDNTDVLSIAGAAWDKLKAYAKIAFLKNNNIKIPNDLRKNELYGRCVVNTIRAKQYTGAITKKKRDITKPKFVTKEGTYYRVVEVITAVLLRTYFQETLIPFSRDNLDAVKKNTVLWEKLHKGYADPELFKKIAHYEAILGYGVDDYISAVFDELDVDMFQEVVRYIKAMYKEARNQKTLSGRHKLFSNYTSGNVWMLYLHSKLEEIGDTTLMDCFYAELPDDALRSSSSKPYVAYGKQPSKKKTGMSRSPSPTNSNEKATKATKDSAVKAASDAIKNSHDELLKMRRMNQLQTLRRKMVAIQSQLLKYKYQHLNTGPDRDRLKKKYRTIKKEKYDCQFQYDELKKKLDYESPVDSSDSSADDNDEQYESNLV